MELASNLVWTAVSFALITGVWRAGRRDELRVSKRHAYVLVVALCIFLLPAISISDDLMEARQAQNWHLAIEAVSTTADVIPVLVACIAILEVAAVVVVRKPMVRSLRAGYFAWISRALSLRPPPAYAF